MFPVSVPWKMFVALRAEKFNTLSRLQPPGEATHGPAPPVSIKEDSAPSKALARNPGARDGLSEKIPYPARITVLPLPQGSQAIPARGCTFLRSEEHTSELQSHSDLVCRLLLEK